MQKGKVSIQFEKPPVIAGMACVAGKKEGPGQGFRSLSLPL